jgi:hypothetical protein
VKRWFSLFSKQNQPISQQKTTPGRAFTLPGTEKHESKTNAVIRLPVLCVRTQNAGKTSLVLADKRGFLSAAHV